MESNKRVVHLTLREAVAMANSVDGGFFNEEDRAAALKIIQDLVDKVGDGIPIPDQVTDLQADNTRLITELRMVRAQLEAAKALMRVGFIERPMSQLMSPTGAACEDLVKLYERIELLEKDGWTSAGPLARQFVKAVKEFDHHTSDDVPSAPQRMLKEWAEKFAAIVGD